MSPNHIQHERQLQLLKGSIRMSYLTDIALVEEAHLGFDAIRMFSMLYDSLLVGRHIVACNPPP